MYKITANDWDEIGLNRVYGSYRNTKVNNTKMKQIAEKYAAKGRDNPSPLERMMIEFLKSHYIKYEFQKPCCIYSNGVIIQFFIVDFYIPSRRLIIETDGKYHEEQIEVLLSNTNLSLTQKLIILLELSKKLFLLNPLNPSYSFIFKLK